MFSNRIDACQVPANADGQIVVGGIEAQTRQVMENLEKVLALAGAPLDDMCKSTVWLHDARDFAAFNRLYMRYFGESEPARSTTEARRMVDAKVGIDVVAYEPKI
ncbi:RidA family protein [Verminephrobacter eiseniae]|nr:RidA family protein [Verminephrobacter eiseniae]